MKNKVSRETSKRIKNILLFFCLFVLIFTFLRPKQFGAVEDIGVKATSYILIDETSGSILAGSEIDKQLGIASTSKVMSAYLFYEYIKENGISLEEKVSFSEKASLMSYNYEISGRKNYPIGTKFTIDELMHLILIESDNSATVALAEQFYGSEEKFVEKMNEEAKEMGLENTVYYNSTGLTMYDYPEGYQGSDLDAYNKSTAREQAILSRNFVEDYPESLEITKLPNNTLDGVVEESYNDMLEGHEFEYTGVTGLKTGTTDEAGACFIGYYTQNKNHTYISVILDAQQSNTLLTKTQSRFYETGTMYDWAKVQKFYYPISQDLSFDVKINGTNGNSQKQIVKPQYDMPIVEDKSLNMSVKEYQLDENLFDEDGKLKEDVEKGTFMGYLVLAKEGEIEIATIFDDLKTEEDVVKIPIVAGTSISTENIFWRTIHGFKSVWSELHKFLFSEIGEND